MKIDNSQIQAIRHADGPAIVIAGPGSGKTTVITRRIQFLVEEKQIEPGTILVITFTRAAANEMRGRFQRLTGHRYPGVSFGTFHSVFFHILKHAYGYRAENIIKEEQRIGFIKEYIHRLRLEYDDENEFVSGILGEISLVKNMCIDLEHYYSTICAEDTFRMIYRAYEEHMIAGGYLDFDDMLVFTRELFAKRPDILRGWQRKFCYIMIDEFQDINPIQYEIIRMLAMPKNRLFIVGDDDQSIYRFRGSKPEIMLHFERDYKDARRFVLDINYRSTDAIVKASTRLIQKNWIRFPKDMKAQRMENVPVCYQTFPHQKEQNLFVIQEILRLHREQQIPYQSMAILIRTNAQPGLLIRQLLEYNIPFLSKEHIPSVYEHWIAQDLFHYIRIAMGEYRRSHFLKIMNRPKRYLSRESLPYEEVSFDTWKSFYKGSDWMVQRLKKLEIDLNLIAKMSPYSAVNYIRKAINYEEYLREVSAERRMPYDELEDVLDEIHENAKEYQSFESWFSAIEEEKREYAERIQNKKAEDDAVLLATLHSAKGLEFDTVFLVDVVENIMPYKKAVLDHELEEERRIFYVGMTRAKNRLYILAPRQIRNKTAEPSRFIRESME